MPENIDNARLRPGLRDRTRRTISRACTRCGARTNACRCTPVAQLDAEYNRNRRIILATSFVCWRCGKPATLGDPLEADHVTARTNGGTNKVTNLRAAHRSCNRRAGAAITNAA